MFNVNDDVGKKELANKLAQGQCNDNVGSSYDPDYLLNHTFKYHPPSAFQQASYAAIRSAAKHLAEVILQNAPASADRGEALRKVREAMMTANAAVATDGRAI